MIQEPCLNDDGDPRVEWPYVLHLAWAARVLAETRPEHHVDIASYIYFATLVSAFIPTSYYEIRAFHTNLSELACRTADLTDLPFRTGSLRSLSCLHSIEHVGLGRYGDTVNPEGDLLAAAELARVLAPGGNLLIVVPLGVPHLRFNSARIYSHAQVLDLFPTLELQEFSWIPYCSNQLVRNARPPLLEHLEQIATGCFWFRRTS